MNDSGSVILIGLGLVGLFLITRLWLWLIVFSVGGLASAIATLVSIVNFQILGIIGFLSLTSMCWTFAFIIYDLWQDKKMDRLDKKLDLKWNRYFTTTKLK